MKHIYLAIWLTFVAAAVAYAVEPIAPNAIFAPEGTWDDGDCPVAQGNIFRWQASCGPSIGVNVCHKHHCADELCYPSIQCPSVSYATGIGQNGDSSCLPFPPVFLRSTNAAVCTQLPNARGITYLDGLQRQIGTDCLTDPDQISCMSASGSDKGCVSTIAQEFAGKKTFLTAPKVTSIPSCDKLGTSSDGTLECHDPTPTPTATP